MRKNRQTQYITPKLFDYGGDIHKQWFVFYSFYNPWSKKLDRIKVYKGFTALHTYKAKQAHAQVIIDELTIKLSAGWNPFTDNPKKVYKDQLEYENSKINRNKTVDYSIHYFINFYIDQRKQNLRNKTFQDYRCKLRIFMKWITFKNYNDVNVKYFTNKDAVDFLNWLRIVRKQKNYTHNCYITVLRSFFNDMISDNIITSNPFDKIKKLQVTVEGKLPFKLHQREQLKNIISKEKPQLWLFIEFIYYCFIRPGELRLLKVGDIDIDGSKILIRGDISKNKKSEYIGIPEVFRKVIIDNGIYKYNENYFIFSINGVPGSEPVGKNHFSNIHRKILKKLEYTKRYSLYSWKATGVVTAVNSGLNIKDIQVQLRHHSLDIVDMYLKSNGAVHNDNIRLNFPTL